MSFQSKLEHLASQVLGKPVRIVVGVTEAAPFETALALLIRYNWSGDELYRLLQAMIDDGVNTVEIGGDEPEIIKGHIKRVSENTVAALVGQLLSHVESEGSGDEIRLAIAYDTLVHVDRGNDGLRALARDIVESIKEHRREEAELLLNRAAMFEEQAKALRSKASEAAADSAESIEQAGKLEQAKKLL